MAMCGNYIQRVKIVINNNIIEQVTYTTLLNYTFSPSHLLLRYGPGDQRFESWYRQKMFFFVRNIHTSFGAHPVSSSVYTRVWSG